MHLHVRRAHQQAPTRHSLPPRPPPCSVPPAGEEPLRMQDLNVCSSLVQMRELTKRNFQ